MRCKNCGWENPANNAKCEKCNASLAGSTNDSGAPEKSSSGKFEPQKTAKGCPECGYPVRDVEKSCPQCGYHLNNEKPAPPAEKEPLPCEAPQPAPKPAPDVPKPAGKICGFCKASVPEAAHFCPNCGASMTNERKNLEGTIKPWVRAEQIQTPECSLSIIPVEGEATNDSPLRFSGNVIQLNRGNTESANQTITSKVQAELYFENNKWYIQDKSALKTTYIYAGDKVELKSGDIIVMGNRSFEFGCVSENQPE